MLDTKLKKIVTNGDDSLKIDVKEELQQLLKDRKFRKKLEYIVSAHQEKLVPSGITVNKNA